MTWSEFTSWYEGRAEGEELEQFSVSAHLLRMLVFQGVALNPNVKRHHKPYFYSDIMKFPTDRKPDEIVVQPVEKLRKIWRV